MKPVKLLFITIVIIALFAFCSRMTRFNIRPVTSDITNWPMNGGTASRTNYYPLSLNLPLELQWVEKASSAIGKTLLAVDSVLYFGTLDGHLNAYSMSDGRRLDAKRFRYHLTPAYENGNIIIALRYGENTLYNVNLKAGKMIWYTDAGDINSEPLVTANGVVVAALYNHIDLYAIGQKTKLWTFETDDQIQSSPALADDNIIFGSDDGYIYSLDHIHGNLKWQVKTEASVQSTPSYAEELDRVFVGSSDQRLYALDANSGRIEWTYEVSGQIFNGIAFSDNRVIFGSTDRHVYCMDAINGNLEWKFKANSVISTNPLIAKDMVIFGSLDKNLYILSLKDGSILWTRELKGRIRTSPVVWGDYLFCASENNYLYAFKGSESPDKKE